jgi:hypothetical protein
MPADCSGCGAYVESVRHRDANGLPLCLTCAEKEPFLEISAFDSGQGHEHAKVKKTRSGDKRPL